VTQVAPFGVETPWPRSIAGVEQETYTDWFRSCSRITVTAHPAVSVPAGFTPEGLPVGLQLVGRYRDEQGLLRVAGAFEAATGFGARRPSL
jgi:amidase